MATLPTLAEVKDYLRVLDNVEDAKIQAMIPRARLWVEAHTGLALVKRDFIEHHVPRAGVVHLYRGPLVTVTELAYTDGDGNPATYVPGFTPPSTRIYPLPGTSWPSLRSGETYEVTYEAGFEANEIDDRLNGAILALIEGEYSDGFAYPQRAIDAAKNCCNYLQVVAV